MATFTGKPAATTKKLGAEFMFTPFTAPCISTFSAAHAGGGLRPIVDLHFSKRTPPSPADFHKLGIDDARLAISDDGTVTNQRRITLFASAACSRRPRPAPQRIMPGRVKINLFIARRFRLPAKQPARTWGLVDRIPTYASGAGGNGHESMSSLITSVSSAGLAKGPRRHQHRRQTHAARPCWEFALIPVPPQVMRTLRLIVMFFGFLRRDIARHRHTNVKSGNVPASGTVTPSNFEIRRLGRDSQRSNRHYRQKHSSPA